MILFAKALLLENDDADPGTCVHGLAKLSRDVERRVYGVRPIPVPEILVLKEDSCARGRSRRNLLRVSGAAGICSVVGFLLCAREEGVLHAAGQADSPPGARANGSAERRVCPVLPPIQA